MFPDLGSMIIIHILKQVLFLYKSFTAHIIFLSYIPNNRITGSLGRYNFNVLEVDEQIYNTSFHILNGI